MSFTEAQKKLRATGFGASELATLVGVGYGSLVELYEAKVNPRQDDGAGLPAELGIMLEQPVADLHAKRTGLLIAPTTTFRHPEHALILATPDRACFTAESALTAARALGLDERGQLAHYDAFQHADRLAEVKTHAMRYRRDYGEEGTGVVPEHEAIQAVVQMAVTGLRLVDLVVLFRGDFGLELSVFHVAYNHELFLWLVEAAERFWHDHVVPKKPPPPDGSDRYDEALARMFPADQRPPVVADAEDEELMLRFAKFRELERRAEVLKKRCAQALKVRMGDAGGMLSATYGQLSWKRTRDSTEVDWQRAAQEALSLGGLVLDGLKRLAKEDARPTDENLTELELRLKGIIPDATKPKPGHRRLVPTFKGDAALELARLNIALDALEDGT